MHDFNDLLFFSRVVQLGSFSKAAKAIGAQVSTVSRRIAALEDRYGVILIQRTTRKLNLTEAGRQLFENTLPHIQALENAQGALSGAGAQPEGLLRITVPVALGKGSFVQFISSFLQKHPKVQIDVIVTNEYVDLLAENIDVAIRFGALKDSSLVAKHLGWSRRMLAAAPSYLKRNSPPRTPQELKQHSCVLFQGRTEESQWELQNDKSVVKVRISGKVSGSNFDTVNELAVLGNGIALLPESYCTDGIQKGVLKPVLPKWSSLPLPVQAIYLRRKFLSSKTQVFLDELSHWKTPNWR